MAENVHIGHVVQVIGPVVDIVFQEHHLPEIYNALEVDIDLSGEDEDIEGLHKHTLTLEVSQHIGDNLIRAISMQPTDGLVRGAAVWALGRRDRAQLEHRAADCRVREGDPDVIEEWTAALADNATQGC